MACFSGPKTINSNVVLYLDAENRNSRGQSRHINQILDGDFSSNTTHSEYVAGTVRQIVQANDVPRTLGTDRNVLQVTSAPTRGGGGNYGGFAIGGMDTLIPGRNYEFSYYARSMTGANLSIVTNHQSGSGDNSNLPFTATITPTWERRSNTVTLNLRKITLYFWLQNDVANTFQITDLMIREAVNANTFVDDYNANNVNKFYDIANNATTTLSGGANFTTANNVTYCVFDGVNDYTSGTLGVINVGSSATIEAMVRLRDVTNLQTIFAHGASGVSFSMGMAIMSGNMRFRNTTADHALSSPSTLVVDQWYHLVLSIAAGETIGYVNGVSQGNTAQVITNNTNTNFAIGRRASNSGSEYLNGDIAFLKVYYNKALTQAEVQQNYEAIRSRYGL